MTLASILMFFALTGAIFLGGSGAAVIGGLYWKRGTTNGAWSALITGALLALAGFGMEQIWPKINGKPFPINGQWIWAITMFLSSAVYVIISIIENKIFDIDTMLHRNNSVKAQSDTLVHTKFREKVNGTLRSLGLSEEFTKWDRVLFWAALSWSIVWILLFAVGTSCNFLFAIPDTSWMMVWKIHAYFTVCLTVLVVVVFSIGGLRDLKFMLSMLSRMSRNDKDDGVVIGHRNRDDIEDSNNSSRSEEIKMRE